MVDVAPKPAWISAASSGLNSNEKLEKHEADHDRLDQKEDSIDLVVALVLRDGSRHHSNEIEHTADDVWLS